MFRNLPRLIAALMLAAVGYTAIYLTNNDSPWILFGGALVVVLVIAGLELYIYFADERRLRARRQAIRQLGEGTLTEPEIATVFTIAQECERDGDIDRAIMIYKLVASNPSCSAHAARAAEAAAALEGKQA